MSATMVVSWRTRRLLAVESGLTLLWAFSAAAQIPRVRGKAAESSAVVFTHVAVIPMESERVLPDQVVVVKGNRIIAIGSRKRIAIPVGARIINGRGEFLLPGLSDMHSHVRANDEAALFLDLANGVTTLRDMGFAKDLEALRTQRAQGALMPPRLYGVIRLQDCDPALANFRQSLRPIDGARLSRCFAKFKSAHYDMLKIYNDGLQDGAYLDSIATAAGRVGFRLGGHAAAGGPGVERALQVSYKSIEHLTGYPTAVLGHPIWMDTGDDVPLVDTMAWLQPGYRLDDTKLRAIAEATRRAGTWNVPTLVARDPLIARAEQGHALPALHAMLRYGEFQRQIIRALRDAGAGLLLGVDQFDLTAGFAVHRELAMLVQAGLTPYEALATATRNVAIFLGTQDSAGTVGVGKWADLLLLNGNPLTDIHQSTAIVGVMADGQWFSRADLDARLDSLETKGCALAILRRGAAMHREISAEELATLRQSIPSCH